MKAATSAMASHIAQGQTTLATCLKLTLIDGTVLGVTEHDQNLVVSGVTYYAYAGFSKFNLSDKANGDSSTIKLEGMVDSTVFLADDIRARRFDYAAFEIFLVNWKDTSPTFGRILGPTGKLGVFTLDEYKFAVDFYGLGYRLSQVGGELLSRDCRVDFGSARCAPGGALADGTTIDSLMQSGAVTATDGYKTIVVSGISNLGKPLDGGLLTWSSGNNQNLSIEVASVDFGTSTIALYLKTFLPIQVGDTFDLQPACDKSISTCIQSYNNAVNFQAEPLVPGDDALVSYPDYHAPHS
jgi:uncharacterized phage protein (TIGR02218 family)